MHLKTSLSSARFEWLLDAPAQACPVPAFVAADEAVIWRAQPISNAFGTGRFENHQLLNGISVFRTVNKFQSPGSVEKIPLAEFQFIFNEPTFLVHTLRKGEVRYKQRETGKELQISVGEDLFQYCSELKAVPYLNGCENIEITSLSVGKTILDLWLGGAAANQLLGVLDLSATTNAVVRPMSVNVSAPLRACLNPRLTGSARRLYAQAKSLEYLAMLADHLGCNGSVSIEIKNRISDLHDYLIKADGKLPCLTFIANKYGCSVRTLNDEFKRIYGSTIYNYLIDYRLGQALEAINGSKIALKQLSAKLGYSHVNNFSAAFKRKYGFSPNTRRKNTGTSILD